MNLRLLGIVGMLGSPGLAMVLLAGTDANRSLALRLLIAVFGTTYLVGWMASVAGLLRLKATGDSQTGQVLLKAQFATLALAILFNFYEAAAPNAGTPLYQLTDACWPLSNVLLLIVSLGIIAANRLAGWKRFVPLLCGLWLPLAAAWRAMLGENIGVALAMAMLHSVAAWWLLGFVVFSSDEPQTQAEPDLLDTL